MILQPIENITKKEKRDLQIKINRIKDKMQTFFEKNINQSWELILKEVNLTESEYVMALRCSLKRPQVFHKRTSLEEAINYYNPIIVN